MFDFTVLVLSGAYPTSVSATVDMLGAAAALAPGLGVPAPRWRVASMEGGQLQLQGGLFLQTVKLGSRRAADDSLWIVPGLGLDRNLGVFERIQSPEAIGAARALSLHVKAGKRVGASCSAVFLLHAAELLHGRRATTSWWLAPALKRISPQCKVEAERMVCADGPIVTAGAAFAQIDLMLHLLREHCGSTLADAVARTLLIDGRDTQASFIVPEVLANGHELVSRIAARAEAALPRAVSVSELASEFCVSERTLSRHVHQATGKSTLALLQSVRLRRARFLLESSRMTVEQVAEAVGYQDATALRRMMKSTVGQNPSRYRPAAKTGKGS